MSQLFKATIRTSESHEVKVIITTQQVKNDINGNPRHAIQVWIDREDGDSNLWTPIVPGYRLNKNDQYITQSHYIKTDITYFIFAFERTVSR